MSLPHHGYWDRLCVSVDPPAPTFDRPLPFIGRLGRRIRRKRRGLGYAFGSAFRTLLVVSKLSLTSRRTHVILWNRRWALLTSLGRHRRLRWAHRRADEQRHVLPLVRRRDDGPRRRWRAVVHPPQARPGGLASSRARAAGAALMYGSRRYRDLHVDAGVDQTPGQLEHYIASRRIHWRERLAGLKHSQRSRLRISRVLVDVAPLPLCSSWRIFSRSARPARFPSACSRPSCCSRFSFTWCHRWSPATA